MIPRDSYLSPRAARSSFECLRAVVAAAVAVAGVSLGGCGQSLEEPTYSSGRSVLGVAGKPLAETSTGTVIADELLVALRDAGDAPAVARDHAATVSYVAERSARVVLRFATPGAASAASAALRRDRRVTDVALNAITDGTGIGTSPGNLPDLQWNLFAMELGDPGLWPTATGVRVAILDTGVAYEDRVDISGAYAQAPDLSGTAFVGGYDFINNDAHANDDEGHGTHIAAIISASSGTVAMARGVEIMPIKVLDHENKGTELSLSEGIRFAADHGADVINMSLSFSPAYYPSRFLQEAIDYATSKGVVLIAASGNHGAEVVSYPAAFRDVVAVGGSKIGGQVSPTHGKHRWHKLLNRIRPAEYSNRGYLVDVLAPAGVIDRDLDGDGNPEAIVAQTFVGGDPLAFDYVLYAGTSQAAAQVSGLAAVLIARQPGLSVAQVRALLGESARAKSKLKAFEDSGRGYVRAAVALAGAEAESLLDTRPRFFASVNLSLHDDGAGRYGRATVEITNEAGVGVKGITVHGTFTGGAVEMVEGKAGNDGVIVFESTPAAADTRLVAFQVDAVSDKINGTPIFDRPRGAVRIDSCSLESLAGYATGSGIGTSPGPVIRFPVSSPGQIDAVTLLNFSWSLATVPMAVTVERAFFTASFENASAAVVTTTGTGIGTSPIVFDPVTSFPGGLPSALLPSGYPDECVDLLVRTFLGDLAETAEPVIPAPNGNCGNANDCASYLAALGSMWDFYVDGQGIGTSPIWEPGSGLSVGGFHHLGLMFTRYADFGRANFSAPVGAYGTVLQAAGLGLAPVGSPVGAGSTAASLPF